MKDTFTIYRCPVCREFKATQSWPRCHNVNHEPVEVVPIELLRDLVDAAEAWMPDTDDALRAAKQSGASESDPPYTVGHFPNLIQDASKGDGAK